MWVRIPVDQIYTKSCQSGRGNKKLKPEFSRIRGGGSISAISICSIDFDMSSTENGMLHQIDAFIWLMLQYHDINLQIRIQASQTGIQVNLDKLFNKILVSVKYKMNV